jgi:hypothetical protein
MANTSPVSTSMTITEPARARYSCIAAFSSR